MAKTIKFRKTAYFWKFKDQLMSLVKRTQEGYSHPSQRQSL